VGDRGFGTVQVAHAKRGARLFNDAAMKIENLAKRYVPH
jgi:hypothetical protein|tara:strand:+ start:469 stop:585 length:117 start_codon:yes stop_codon:yes gene_type:complete